MHYLYLEKIGGAEVQAFNLATELARRGYLVTYIAQNLTGSKIKQEVINGVVVHWIKESKGFQITAFFRLRRLMKTIDADVYYNRIAGSYTGNVGRFCRKHKKLFVFACSEDKHCETGYFLKAAREELQNYQKGFAKKLVLKILALAENYLYYRGLRTADVIISQNRKQQDLLRKHFSLDSILLYPGHPLPNPGTVPKKEMIVAWIANLNHKKQPELFVQLAKVCRDLPCRFVMAGKPTQYNSEEKISELVENISNFEFRGQLTLEESNELLDVASIVVNTSKKDREGFPNVYVQALMRGNVVLTFDVDPDNILQDNGFGFRCQNIEEMSQKIKAYLGDEHLLNQMAQKAKAFAREQFALEKLGNDFEEILARRYSNAVLDDTGVLCRIGVIDA